MACSMRTSDGPRFGRLKDIWKLIEIEFQACVGDFGAYGERFRGGNLASLRSALSAKFSKTEAIGVLSLGSGTQSKSAGLWS